MVTILGDCNDQQTPTEITYETPQQTIICQRHILRNSRGKRWRWGWQIKNIVCPCYFTLIFRISRSESVSRISESVSWKWRDSALKQFAQQLNSPFGQKDHFHLLEVDREKSLKRFTICNFCNEAIFQTKMHEVRTTVVWNWENVSLSFFIALPPL